MALNQQAEHPSILQEERVSINLDRINNSESICIVAYDFGIDRSTFVTGFKAFHLDEKVLNRGSD